ncbi:LysM peptidoglycan-binding domain-containing protein [Mycoplasmatota bacterium WC44]
MDRYDMFNENEYFEPNETYFKMRVIDGTYTVQQGDNLGKIAIEFGTTVDELVKLNKLNTTTVFPGQILVIPESMEKTMSYTVQLGDNLYTIAKRYNTTVEELMMLNNLENNLIFPNQILLIPYQENENGMYYKEYITVDGDTLESIAQDFNIKPKKILMYNDIMKLVLAPNQVINIPAVDKKYKILEEDTWQTILEKSGLTLEKLVELNKDMWFKPGKKLIIR